MLTEEAAREMLKLAKLTKDDRVIDLTYGDALLGMMAAAEGARATVYPVCAAGVRSAITQVKGMPDRIAA